MNWPQVRVVGGGRLPKKGLPDDAAYDCFVRGSHRITRGETVKVPLGFCVAVPRGMAGHIVLRSGRAANGSLVAPGGYGVIDPGYTGEVMAIVRCMSEFVVLEDGDRIVQLEFVTVPPTTLAVVDTLEESERGECGFGSSGAR